MRKSIMAAPLVPLFVAALAAQVAGPGQSPSSQTPAPRTSASTEQRPTPTTTLAGCLYREDQIPGRTPNVAERAGVLEDYILADASVAGSQANTPGASSTTASSGNMYKVEGPSDEQLKALVGKRVEVMGRIDPEGGSGAASSGKPQPDRGLGPDDINLPEFEASSIREVAGNCPAAPAPRK
jgi:hypothetical protein